MRFLSKKEVRALVCLSYATMDRWEKAGQFPKRVVLGDVIPIRYTKGSRAGRYKAYNCRVVWVEQEVLDWMQARIDRR
jgi:prophage regulatory protein